MGNKIIEVNGLKKYFPIRSGVMQRVTAHVKAVDNVSFSIEEGHTLGLVGESVCGKTTVGRTLLRLIPATEGSVIYNGQDLFKLKKEALRKIRPEIQIVFQDPYSSLSPRMPVGEIIGEAVREHNLVPKSEYRKYVMDIMDKCGLMKYHIDRLIRLMRSLALINFIYLFHIIQA